MPIDPGRKQQYYENMMGDTQNMLGQYNIATGRSANPLQMYQQSQGYSSSLLDYDLKRRQLANERWDRLAQFWKTGHDARKAQPSALESGVNMGLGTISAIMGAYTGYKQGQQSDALTSYLGSKTYAKGGVIDEPVVGRGLETGRNYLLGEEGPERVSPMEEESDDFWEIFNKKKSEEQMNEAPLQTQQSQQQPQQQQGGQSQMSPSSMLSIAQKTPLNKYLGPFADKAGLQATPQTSGYGATSTPAYSSAYLAPEAGGMAVGEAGAGAGAITGAEGGGAVAGGEAMAGMSGGTGGSGAAGGLGMGTGIGAIIAAAIAAQHAAALNTGTRTDPSTGERLNKGDAGYYQGHKSGDVFSGDFGSEPWLALAHDKLGLGPTAGEQFDAAEGSDKFAKAPAMLDYWANPLGTWTADIGEKALGKKGGKAARWALNPLGEALKKIF